MPAELDPRREPTAGGVGGGQAGVAQRACRRARCRPPPGRGGRPRAPSRGQAIRGRAGECKTLKPCSSPNGPLAYHSRNPGRTYVTRSVRAGGPPALWTAGVRATDCRQRETGDAEIAGDAHPGFGERHAQVLRWVERRRSVHPVLLIVTPQRSRRGPARRRRQARGSRPAPTSARRLSHRSQPARPASGRSLTAPRQPEGTATRANRPPAQSILHMPPCLAPSLVPLSEGARSLTARWLHFNQCAGVPARPRGRVPRDSNAFLDPGNRLWRTPLKRRNPPWIRRDSEYRYRDSNPGFRRERAAS